MHPTFQAYLIKSALSKLLRYSVAAELVDNKKFIRVVKSRVFYIGKFFVAAH